MIPVRPRNISCTWWDVTAVASSGGSKAVSASGVLGSHLRPDGRGVMGGGAIERTSRPFCGTSDSLRAGWAGRLEFVLALAGGNSDLAADFRLLLLTGCLVFLGGVERFNPEGLSDLQKSCCKRRVVDPTMKAYTSGTPSGYFSRRRRMISVLFMFALRLSLWRKRSS